MIPRLVGLVPPGRRYVMIPWSLSRALQKCQVIEEPETNIVFWLDPGHLPSPRACNVDIKVQGDTVEAIIDGKVAAKCSLLWKSPFFAELVVATESEFRGRGLGKIAVSTMAGRLFEEGVTPIYITNVDNVASIGLAESLGFRRCPDSEFAGYMTRPGR